MTRQIEFETAGLAAAVGKAARVAPSKGVAFDKAAGLVMRVPESGAVEIRATNLEVDYLEWVTPTEQDDEAFDWRFPSALVAGFLSGLPQGVGKRVTFTQDGADKPVVIKSGRTTARVNAMPMLGFKEWDAFDTAGMTPVTGLAQRINQAQFATDAEVVPLSGINIDGTWMFATDRYRMVRLPLEVKDLPNRITVPLDKLAPILANVEDVLVAATERQFLIMPDEYTQIAALIFDAPFPPVERVMKNTFDKECHLPRLSTRDAITRMLSLVGRGERYPRMGITFKPGVLELEMEVPGVGRMDDEIDCDYDGPEHQMDFTPTYLSQPLDAAKGDSVLVGIDYEKRKPLYMTDDKGFECWIQPRNPGDKVPVKKEEEE